MNDEQPGQSKVVPPAMPTKSGFKMLAERIGELRNVLARGKPTVLEFGWLAGGACLGAARMHSLRFLGVYEVHTFADDDQSERVAAQSTSEALAADGQRVVTRLPPKDYKDWGDVVAPARVVE